MWGTVSSFLLWQRYSFFSASGWLKYTVNYKDIPFMVTESCIRIYKQWVTDVSWLPRELSTLKIAHHVILMKSFLNLVKTSPNPPELCLLLAINANSCTVRGMCSGYKFLICQWFLMVMNSWYWCLVKLFFVSYLKINNVSSARVLLVVESSYFLLQKKHTIATLFFHSCSCPKARVQFKMIN